MGNYLALEIHEPDGNVRIAPVGSSIMIVGRDHDADLQLDGPQVSRRHARILQRGNNLFIADAQSTNGTFVNGLALARERERELNQGDEIRVGPFRILVVADDGTTISDRPGTRAHFYSRHTPTVRDLAIHLEELPTSPHTSDTGDFSHLLMEHAGTQVLLEHGTSLRIVRHSPSKPETVAAIAQYLLHAVSPRPAARAADDLLLSAALLGEDWDQSLNLTAATLSRTTASHLWPVLRGPAALIDSIVSLGIELPNAYVFASATEKYDDAMSLVTGHWRDITRALRSKEFTEWVCPGNREGFRRAFFATAMPLLEDED